jgi:hypothetical protein
MQVALAQFSADQADAFDSLAELFARAGVDIENSITTPRAEGKSEVMAVRR